VTDAGIETILTLQLPDGIFDAIFFSRDNEFKLKLIAYEIVKRSLTTVNFYVNNKMFLLTGCRFFYSLLYIIDVEGIRFKNTHRKKNNFIVGKMLKR
jgi:hypothetical protein